MPTVKAASSEARNTIATGDFAGVAESRRGHAFLQQSDIALPLRLREPHLVVQRTRFLTRLVGTIVEAGVFAAAFSRWPAAGGLSKPTSKRFLRWPCYRPSSFSVQGALSVDARLFG